MKTLRKIDLDSMERELQVLKKEEEKAVLGGTKVNVYSDPNDVPGGIWDMASGYVDDSGNWYGGESGSYSGNDEDKSWTKSFNNEDDLRNFLCDWVSSPGYVEAEIYFHADGSYTVVRDNENTPNRAYYDFQGPDANGKYYRDGKEIIGFGHTHSYDDSPYPGKADQNAKKELPKLSHQIFHDGHWYKY
ncbi:MAG: hypothetical protein LIO93_06480 [Bacteroidales bacterium]|nr:hypothetical protein [Bacteroidales bacterium]